MTRILLVVAATCGSSLALDACSAPPPTTMTARPEPAVPEGPLPKGVAPTHYRLSLTIVPERQTFNGEVSIDVELTDAADGIWLHGEKLRVSKAYAEVDGRRVAAQWKQVTNDGVARLSFAETLPAGSVVLRITYDADFDTQLKGLYRVVSDGEAYAFTQFQAIRARLAFPSFDEPRFKTPFDITLTVPEGQVAAGNTPAVQTEAGPNGLRRVRYATTPALPTYLIAWAVGPLEVVDAPPLPPNSVRDHPVPFRGIAAKGKGDKLDYAFTHTAAMLTFLEEYFGIPYPYRKLDVVAVPDFAAGAMENVGLITFREPLLLLGPDASESQKRFFAYVMAHELAHQWFGNLVTMPWWDDIWLNESFASWIGTKVIEALYPEYRADLAQLAYTHDAMRYDSLTSAQPIRQPIRDARDIGNAFSAIIYSKGAAVLQMFEEWMSPEVFRAGVRAYLREHREATATASDLMSALDQVDDRDVTGPFQSFLTQPGVPWVDVDCAPDAPVLNLSQRRYFAAGSPGDPDQQWQVPLCLVEPNSSECILLRQRKSETAKRSCPPWLMPNRQGAGYFRFSLSESGWEALRNHGFSKLSQGGRLAVVDSVRAAFDNGSVDTPQLVSWFSPFVRGSARQEIEAPMEPLSFIIQHGAPSSMRPRVRAYGGSLYRPLYRKLGWRSRNADTSDQKLLREAVIRFLLFDAQDPAVRRRGAQLGQRYAALLEEGVTSPPVDPEVSGLALAVAVQEGGAPTFDKLLATLDESTSATLRARILEALANTEDPELSERALALALAPEIRLNEIALLLRPQFANKATQALAWSWLKKHFDELAMRMGKDPAGASPWYVSSFCSEEAQRDAKRFLTPKVADLPGGPRNLSGALETVSLCIARVATQRPSIVAEFGSPGTR